MSPKKLSLLVLLLIGVIAALLPFLYDVENRSLDDAVRAESRGSYIGLSQGVTHYQLEGPQMGRTVVLVHGFSVPYYIWDPTYDALVNAGNRVLRYDLYGRGYSDRPEADYDGQLFEQQLSELLKRLEISSPVDLFGLSMGGAIAVDYAVRHPEQVRSLVLVDPAHRGRDSTSLLDLPGIGEYLMSVRIAPTMAEGQLSDFVEPEKFPDWADKYREQMKFRGFKRAILSTMRHYFHEDHWASYIALGNQRKPVLLVWGREDQTIPFSQSKEVQEVLGASLLAIAGAGHIPHYEKATIVNPEILRFLAEEN